MRHPIPAVILVTLLLAAAPAALATTFCGCNGDIALSFTAPADLTPVTTADMDDKGLTTVEVYAVLDGVEELEGPRGVFLDLGGFELDLRISGAEAVGVEKEFLIPYRDFASRPTQCLVGTHPGERVVGGPLALVKWKVTFLGEVADVRFDLDPDGMLSCERTEGCLGCGASMVYVGTMDAGQEGYLFGAGCMPAVLNPTGEPDLTPAPCTEGFAEVGVYAPRD